MFPTLIQALPATVVGVMLATSVVANAYVTSSEDLNLSLSDIPMAVEPMDSGSDYLGYTWDAEVEPTQSPSPTPKLLPTQTQATVVASAQVRQSTLPASELDPLFSKYGNEYGIDTEKMKRVAKCESGLNPGALSLSGAYGGLFQFVSSTWASNRNAMGLDPSPDLRFNAEESIRTAAFKMSRDGFGAWPVCGQR
jgi:soluble lytic murein transglycosylase-like protein